MKRIAHLSVWILIVLAVCSTAVANSPRPDHAVLYARVAMVYVGEMKGYRFTKELLEEFGKTFVGRPLLKAHDWSDPDACVGRIVSTQLKFDKERKLHYLEGIVAVLDEKAIPKVRKGLYHYLSIGITGITYACSIDKTLNCRRHRKGTYVITSRGREYVFWDLKSFLGQELSFVNVPASRWARVLSTSSDPMKIKTRSATERKAVFAEIPSKIYGRKPD